MGSYDVSSSMKLLQKDSKRRITRNAMGEYIVPSGGKPLTSLVDSTPGPSEYLPKLDCSKFVAPQYSLAGPYRRDKVTYSAGPGDYDVGKDMKWNRRLVHVKGKGTTRPYAVRDKAHVNDSIGPGRYNVGQNKNSLVWECSPKWSLKYRHRDGINAGHPAHQIQPVDTYRHHVPSPTVYRPNSKYSRSKFKGHGPEYSFGTARRHVPSDNPGPADHDVYFDTSGEPGKTFGEKLPPVWNQQNDVRELGPGPGAYELETFMGKGLSKTVGELPPTVDWDPAAPPPNLYMIPDLMGSSMAPHTAHVNWRPFTPKRKAQPGPTDYHPLDSNRKKPPKYTFRGPTKPVYPDVMHYPNIAVRVSGENPGPGQYEQITGTLAINKSPRFSMGKKLKARTKSMPAPNQYSPSHAPDAPKAPSYSFGSRLDKVDRNIGPGPAAYLPQVPKSGVAFSMLHRPVNKNDSKVPGPNNYKPQDGQTRKGSRGGAGVTFKGRPSPFVFSGRKGTGLLEAQ